MLKICDVTRSEEAVQNFLHEIMMYGHLEDLQVRTADPPISISKSATWAWHYTHRLVCEPACVPVTA